MAQEELFLRVTPVEVAAGVGQILEIDLSGAKAIFVAEMTSWGTSAGEISIAIGDQGDFFTAIPGAFVRPGGDIRRVRLRNNTATIKKLVLWYSYHNDFMAFVTPTGV